MRLGVCGMLPGDFRNITHRHLDAIRALGLTGAAFHGAGDQLFDVRSTECDKVRTLYAGTVSAGIFRDHGSLESIADLRLSLRRIFCTL